MQKMTIKNLIIDITGVLYESGVNKPINGSISAVHRLMQSDEKSFIFLTNETEKTRASLVQKLNSIGFNLNESQIVSPGFLTRKYLEENNLRPHLLISPELEPEFEGIDQKDPNCVVLGDASHRFTYDNLNLAFQILINLKDKKLISMGKGKYYQNFGELWLDVGAYTAALQYSTQAEPYVIGKPSEDYFRTALKILNAKPEETLMIGDDIESDVHAAQKIGIRGCLVRSGKYRAERDEQHATIKPFRIVDNLEQVVNQVLSGQID